MSSKSKSKLLEMTEEAQREQLLRIYAQTRTIGVVGASADESKAAHKIPRYLRISGDFPMTVTGKVQKYKMREVSVAEVDLGEAAGTQTA